MTSYSQVLWTSQNKLSFDFSLVVFRTGITLHAPVGHKCANDNDAYQFYVHLHRSHTKNTVGVNWVVFYQYAGMSQSDWPKFAVVDESTNNAVRSNVSRNGHALKASLYLTLIFWQKQIDNG